MGSDADSLAPQGWASRRRFEQGALREFFDRILPFRPPSITATSNSHHMPTRSHLARPNVGGGEQYAAGIFVLVARNGQSINHLGLNMFQVSERWLEGLFL